MGHHLAAALGAAGQTAGEGGVGEGDQPIDLAAEGLGRLPQTPAALLGAALVLEGGDAQALEPIDRRVERSIDGLGASR
jgi:hypothetical protein